MLRVYIHPFYLEKSVIHYSLENNRFVLYMGMSRIPSYPTEQLNADYYIGYDLGYKLGMGCRLPKLNQTKSIQYYIGFTEGYNMAIKKHRGIKRFILNQKLKAQDYLGFISLILIFVILYSIV